MLELIGILLDDIHIVKDRCLIFLILINLFLCYAMENLLVGIGARVEFING